jgi:hypothetical protein
MTSWSNEDEMLLREVIEDGPIEYETLVLLGPPPLRLSEVLFGVFGVAMCFASAVCMVTGLYVIAGKLF